MKHLIANLSLVGLTLLIGAVAYPMSILAVAQGLFPTTANGSLVTAADGRIVGSSLIAQPFMAAHYLHPRPSAADYNATASAGSNLSANNPKLRERVAQSLATDYPGETAIPSDLVTASGSGLDPHITHRGAIRQASRVATARGQSIAAIEELLAASATTPLGGEPLINVLKVNQELDRRYPRP